jgi:hypothetical protein
MFMCTTKFDIEEKHLAFIKQYMTKEEDEEAEEERSAQLLADDLADLISDDEEDDSLSVQSVIHGQDASGLIDLELLPSSIEDNMESSEALMVESEDDDNPLPLPPTQFTTHPEEAFHRTGSPRKRVSSRVRVPSKRLKDYVV